MRRTVLVPTMVAAASRVRHVLLAASLAAMLTLALALAAPVAAQEQETTSGAQTATRGKDTFGKQEQVVQGSGQEAEEDDERAAARASESLPRSEALIIDDDSDGTADRIEIDAVGCTVDKGAVLTVEDESGDSAAFTNAPDVNRDAGEVEATIEPVGDQVVVEIVGDDLPADFGPEGDTEDEAGTVTSSTGVACDRAAAANTENENAAEDENEEDATRTADELASLSCADLLVLFRAESGSGQQYGDADVFADGDVRAQVEVCLKKEIVSGPDGKLPKTGGLSLLALAVLGVVSAAAGLSVIRGGQR